MQSDLLHLTSGDHRESTLNGLNPLDSFVYPASAGAGLVPEFIPSDAEGWFTVLSNQG